MIPKSDCCEAKDCTETIIEKVIVAGMSTRLCSYHRGVLIGMGAKKRL